MRGNIAWPSASTSGQIHECWVGNPKYCSWTPPPLKIEMFPWCILNLSNERFHIFSVIDNVGVGVGVDNFLLSSSEKSKLMWKFFYCNFFGSPHIKWGAPRKNLAQKIYSQNGFSPTKTCEAKSWTRFMKTESRLFLLTPTLPLVIILETKQSK